MIQTEYSQAEQAQTECAALSCVINKSKPRIRLRARAGRESKWFVDGVKKYHRTFSTIVNTLVEEGFNIEKMIEPAATDEMTELYPKYRDLRHKPDFLVVKARRV